MARGFDSAPSRGGNDSAKLEELFDMFDPKTATKAYVALRFLPLDMLPVRRHWIQSKTKEGKPTAFPKMCVAFDPDNPAVPLKGRKCPFCELEHGQEDKGYPARLEEYMLANVIVRDLQDTMRVGKMTPEEKKTGFKDVTSKSATPVRVIRIPCGVARRLDEMSEMNKGKKVTDPKYGIDVLLKFNPKAAPAEMYKLERGERTPLERDEEAFLVYNLSDYESIYDAMGRLDSKSALADFKRMNIVGLAKDTDDEDEDGGFRAGRNAGKKKNDAYDDEYEDDEEDDEDEDDEDEKPSRRKPSRSASKKPASRSRFADDEDDAEDEDEDEEDEDEKPSRRSSKKPAAKPASRSRFADEDDDDEDDDDEDDEDDEDDKPSRRPSKVKPKNKAAAGKSRSRFDEDEDEEEEDEEEDERPARRSSAATAGRSGTRSSSSSTRSKSTASSGRSSSGKSSSSSRTGSTRSRR